MHFSSVKNGSGSKVTKVAVVGLFHFVLALGLIHTMSRTSIPRLPHITETSYIPEKHEQAVEPPVVTKAPPQIAPPTVTIEQPVIDIAKAVEPAISAPPGPPQVVDTGKTQIAPTVTTGGGGKGGGDTGSSGAMRTAVFAEGCALPDYPARAARNGDTGTVTLALLVAANGKVVDSKVQTSSGHRDLDKAAQAALSMCKFKAATSGGVAEQAWSQIAYVWTLD